MLSKLAFKNASKSIRDYAVYFFTLVLAVCIFYMFNSIYAQRDIMVVTETTAESMKALRQILSYISVFVAVVLGFLIVYANNFFIRRRKKELGVYMTLGMSKRNISMILTLETSFMAGMALATGLLLGIFGSQMMSVFTAKIFEADLSAYRFVFAPDAAVKSVIYFGVIFLVVMLLNTIVIGKYKLIDLLYGGRKNETIRIKNMKTAMKVFVASILCLAAAYVLILNNGIIHVNLYFALSIILGTVGTLLFFWSLSGILVKIMWRNKRLYFKQLNMFVVRQFSSKINTNFVSLSVVCIVLLLVIGIFSTGYSMQNILSTQLRTEIPYEYSVIDYNNGETDTILSRLPSEIKDSSLIADSYECLKGTMADGKAYYKDYDVKIPETLAAYGFGDLPLTFVSLSDYNGLRKLQGMDELDLSEKNYRILYDKENVRELAEQFYDKNINLTIDGNVLSPVNKAEEFTMSNSDHGQIIFVVADTWMNNMNVDTMIWNVQCVREDAAKEFSTLLDNYQEKDERECAFTYYVGKQQVYESSVTTKATIAFLAIYLGIVFMIACAAILAIQQLSEATDNVERYNLLKKLGVERRELNHALFIQILSYFLLPLLLAVIHSIVGLTVASREVIKAFGDMNVASTIFVTSVFIVLVYGSYFLLTYVGSKSVINKG
ncbi:MAG: FtsX-like permease family protein [Dorea sp.]|nr:FtsX-like permease family protein [Dorea sp.]